MTKYTTYDIAVHWLDGRLILCNNICEVDPSVLENARFSLYDEETETEEETFQWYLTAFSENEVEWLENQFDLKFSYSDILDCFILCVDHWGTSWDYVSCEVKGDFLKYNPELEYSDSCNPPKMDYIRKITPGKKEE